MKEIISIKDVSKKFGDKTALKDISFDVNMGEIIGIVGHNGAGKTTLINCMVDIYQPDKGNIDFIFDKKSLYDHIGVQMQNSYFEPRSKVIDICKLYKKLTNSDANILELLEEFELKDEAKNNISNLSGGKKQRLAILLTLIHQPEVVFLDELTSGLDPVARRRVWEVLKLVNKKKATTIILTSHFLDEIEYLADRILILNKGEMAYMGTVGDSIERYSDGEKVIEFQIKDERASFKLAKYNAVELPGNRYQIKTKDDERVLKGLIDDAGIRNLIVKSPTLEDVFLKIAGYRLDSEGRIVNE
ncbi:ABC transporter ATP-binding protein [Alkaliphilus serpentinus]|uniref:ABC transporter ATP-binding protein n=1 Tax=Alkaliphilus serpentinus TaxID=1482731 RepID=A0A833HR32_9FIRM|nr:ABC transporter ATP-binding protein [Alkaliphilus serpentinus]KAB3532825.1 ABC transporter ATP-binding protein [Alkaliphilus serpentinus]